MDFYLSPLEATELFSSDGEFAALDVREQEEFSRGHILVSSCAPLSRLELMVRDLVPCLQCPIVLVDSGQPDDRRASKAKLCLEAMGYAKVFQLLGGMAAWKKAGLVEFTGVGALSKGFGEYVEEKLHTTRLEPREIKELMDSGQKYAVFDVRPREEYQAMNIPGSINVPGCEITYRIGDLVKDPETTIIINCAGRTRSIIGTQTLRNAQLPNRVVALKGGTMNWQLAGLTLEYGSNRASCPPSPEGLKLARQRAADVAQRYGVRFVDAKTLDLWRSEAEQKSLYIFDVRQPEEFLMGHAPGARNAPGGQLVQATDEYAAVRHARYVITDDTEVRAIMTAHWLIQMGLPHVYVLQGGLAGSGLGARGLEYGAAKTWLPATPEVPLLPCHEAHTLAGKALFINVGSSRVHRKAHVPGAVWVPRGYLHRAAETYPEATNIVITADTELHAALTTKDAESLWPKAHIACLKGGNEAWVKAGLPAEEGMPTALAEEVDVWYKPYTDINAKPEAMQGYFDWEFGLVEQITKDGAVRFDCPEA